MNNDGPKADEPKAEPLGELIAMKGQFETLLESMIFAAREAKAFVTISISIDGRDEVEATA